jgi:methylenetetrahydrofolate reductase (NADPH)
MKVVDIIKESDKTVFSFELLPPLKGQNADKLYHTIEDLLEYDPKYINLTAHRDEVEFRELDSGLLEKRIVRKRPGTVAIAAAIQHKYGVPVVPHIVCGGYSKEETENMMLDLNFLEIDLKNKTPMDFCIGVAGYPEKHAEASNLDADLKYLKQKVEAGAEYVVTQMFFDNQKYYDFVDKCRANGITVPIIPGIKPLSTVRQTTVLPKVFNIDIPEEFASEIRKCKNNDEARIVGTEWAIEQAKDLIAHNAPCLHIYTYGITDNTKQIAKAVF